MGKIFAMREEWYSWHLQDPGLQIAHSFFSWLTLTYADPSSVKASKGGVEICVKSCMTNNVS